MYKNNKDVQISQSLSTFRRIIVPRSLDEIADLNIPAKFAGKHDCSLQKTQFYPLKHFF